jgi:tetratricopeptide (TPR) repeat protein
VKGCFVFDRRANWQPAISMKHFVLTSAVVLLLAASLVGYQSKQEPATGPTAVGIALYLKGDLDGAVKALRDAVKKDKSDARAWHYLGLSFMAQGDQKKAAEAFDKAEELRTRNFDKEFDDSDDVIREEQVVRLTGLLRELIEIREKLVEVNSPRKPTTFEQLNLDIARARASCMEQNTRVVDGHMTLKKSDLNITKLHATKRAEPDFPASEHKPNVDAKVMFRGIVGADGSVRYLEILQSSNDAFAAEAKRAAYKTQFRPASICGRRISFPIQLEYSFHSSP